MGAVFVTDELEADPRGGRALLGRLFHDALADVFAGDFATLELRRLGSPRASVAASVLRGHVDGVHPETIRRVVDEVRTRHAPDVVLDGSNLGALARAVKRAIPAATVTTLFHNVEARFFWGALKATKTPRALGVLAANLAAERQAVAASDRRIALTPRDDAVLRRLYGRGATHVAPLALRDVRPAAPAEGGRRDPYYLFVGSAFYANLAGIAWFARRVAPRLAMSTVVVGRGLEAYRALLESRGGVEVVGGVDDLAPWYRDARLVVAPLFDGSGMKTKVAEALMFGKAVVGTPDAFAGYEAVRDCAGAVASTSDDFVNALEGPRALDPPAFDARRRAAYEAHYSPAAAAQRFRAIFAPE